MGRAGRGRLTFGALCWAALACGCQAAEPTPAVPAAVSPKAEVDVATSRLTLAAPSVVVGETVGISLSWLDAAGAPVSLPVDAWQLSVQGTSAEVSLAAWQLVGVGTWASSVLGVAAGGTVELSASCAGRPLQQTASLEVLSAPADPSRSRLVVAPAQVAAGQAAQVVVLCRDAQGQPAAAAPSAFVVGDDGGARQARALGLGPLVATDLGSYAATLAPTQAGQWSLGASLGSAVLASTTASLVVQPGPAVSLRDWDGQTQAGLGNTLLPGALAVQALDAYGNPCPRTPLVWQATAGEIVTAEQATDADGLGRAHARLAASLGPQTYTARLAGATAAAAAAAASVAFAADALPQLPDLGHLYAALESSGDLVADGTAAAVVQVRLADASGAPVVGCGLRLAVGGLVAPTVACGRTDALGQGQCQVTSTAAGVGQLTLVQPLVQPVGEVRFVAGPPAAAFSQLWTTAPGTAVADGVQGLPLTALLVDAQGNACTQASAAPLRLAAPDPQIACSWRAASSDAAGLLPAMLLSGVAETAEVGYAEPAALVPVAPTAVHFAPPAASGLAFTQQPGGAVAGQPLAQMPRLSLQSASGGLLNDGPGQSSVVSLAWEGATGLAGTSARAAVGGVVDFAGSSLRSDVVGTFVMRATTAGGLSARSAPVGVVPAAAAKLAFTQAPAQVVSDAIWPAPVQVVALDALGHVQPTAALNGAQLRLQLASGAPLLGPTTAAWQAGGASFSGLSARLSEPGAVLTAALHLGDGPDLVGQSAPFVIGPGVAKSLAFVGALPATVAADMPWASAPRLELRDAAGNTVDRGPDSSAMVTLSRATGDASLDARIGLARPAVAGRVDFAGADVSAGPAGSGLVLAADKADLTGVGGGPALHAEAPALAVGPGPPAALTLTGCPSTAVAGAPLPDLTVAATDANGLPVPLTLVRLSSLGSCGPPVGQLELDGASVDSGVFSGISLRQAGAGCRLVASASVAGGAVVVGPPLTIVPAAAAKLLFTQQPQPALGGQRWPGQPQVAVVDAYDNLVTSGADAAASISLAWAGGGDGLAGTLTSAAAAGVASFTDVSASGRRSGAQLLASASLAGAPCSARSQPFDVPCGVATQIIWQAQPSQVGALSVWPVAPRVALLDAQNELVDQGRDSAAMVRLSLSQGTGVLSGDTALSAAGGVAAFDAANLTIDLAGDNKMITAEADTVGGTIAGSSQIFSVEVGPAVRLRFVQQPSDGSVGQALATQPQVALFDHADNPILTGADANARVSLQLEASDDALGGTITQAAVNGVATFTDVSVLRAQAFGALVARKDDRRSLGGTYTTVATSTPINIAPSTTATALRWAVPPGDGVAGAPLARAPMVQLVDAYGNVVVGGPDSGATLTVALHSGGPLAGTLSRQASAGQASFAGLAASRAGVDALVATAAVGVGPVACASPNFTVTAGPPTALTFVSAPAAALVDAALSPAPQVAGRDAAGNLSLQLPAGALVTLRLGAGVGGLVGALTQPVVGGLASFPGLAADALGDKRLAAGATSGAATWSGLSSPFTVAANGSTVTLVPLADPAQSTLGDGLQRTADGVQVAPAELADAGPGDLQLGQGLGLQVAATLGAQLGAAGGCDGSSSLCLPPIGEWAPAPSALVAAWPLDGAGAGTPIADGAALAATVGPSLVAHNPTGGSPGTVAGQVGGALGLAGGDDGAAATGLVALAAAELSVAAWVRPGGGPPGAAAWQLQGDGGALLQLTGWGSGSLQAEVTAPGVRAVAQAPGGEAGAWTHVVVGLGDGELALWVDGVRLAAVATGLSGQVLALQGVALGSAASGPSFAGAVDALQVWATLLNDDQVAQLADAQTPRRGGIWTGRVWDGQTPRQAVEAVGWQAPLPWGRPLPNDASGASESSADFAGLAATQLASGLSAAWRLDAAAAEQLGAGRDFADTSGAGNVAFLWPRAAAAIYGAPGPLGRSLQIVDAGAQVATTQQLSLGAQDPFSLSIWWRGSGGGGGRLIGFADQSVGPPSDALQRADRHLYLGADGRLRLGVYDGAAAQVIDSGALPLADNVWHHAVGSWSPTQGMQLFVDGQPVAVDASVTTAAAYAGYWRLGDAGLPGSSWAAAPSRGAPRARLGEAAVWSRALSAAEVLALYRRGAGALGLQLRACARPDCSDAPAWAGPDGSAGSLLRASDAAAAGALGAGSVAVNLAAWPKLAGRLQGQRYLQARAWLQDFGAQPAAPTFAAWAATPALPWADTGGAVTLQPALPARGLASVAAVLGSAGCAGQVRFTLSTDAGASWLWHQAGLWGPGGGDLAHSNAAGELDAPTLGALADVVAMHSLQVRAFLLSDGQLPCAVAQLRVESLQ